LRQERNNKKADILCRDIVGAHAEFVAKVSSLSTLVQFQEQLLGVADSAAILDKSSGFIKKHLFGTSVAIFLIEPKGFDIHFSEPNTSFLPEKGYFENWFTYPLVQEISRCNQVCTLEKLLEMGLQATPASLKHITAAAIPLGRMGKGVGLILLYRPAERPFQTGELAAVSSMASVLRIAIENSQASLAAPVDTSLS
jgi:GAF domain-containing protein